MVANKEFRIAFAVISLLLVIDLIFIFIDMSLYSLQEKENKMLDKAANSDAIANIANRNYLDEIIEKYTDVAPPEGLCCIMFELTSLWDINEHYSRTKGNEHIKVFSRFLNLSAIDKCIVGRNGGNVFLAIFEEASKDDVTGFLNRIRILVKDYNADKGELCISYRYGVSHNSDEHLEEINQLISLANSRLKNGEG